MNIAARILSAAALCAVASAALAHHSFAMFDQSKTVELRGSVTELQWTNPHVFLHVEVADASGKVTWEVELNSPNNLRREGWKADSVKVGDKVVVSIHPLRDGSHGGLFISVTLPDGKVLGEPGGFRGPINVPKAD